jgi:transposase-like protein
MPTVLRVRKGVKVTAEHRAGLPEDLNVRVALIQALIPLGMEAVVELLQQDVQALVGPRYARGQRPFGLHRWTRQAGSIYLADQKLRILRPRVRNRHTRQEVSLQTYAQLQHPRAADEGVLRRILHGLSCREYRACAEAVPEAFGLSASTMSRRYIRASARKLQALQERRLDQYAFVALVLDGKTFQDDTLVVALGITVQGEKVLLGFVETGTENETTCAEFLQGLVERGLRSEDGLLIVMDGGKGLRAGARRVFGADTPVQRCQWHKRENVVAYVPKAQQGAVARQAPAGVRTADLCGSQSGTRGRPERAQADQ